MSDPILTLNTTMIDRAISEIIEHEQTIFDDGTGDDRKLVFGENAGIWRGSPPDQPQMNLQKSAYLWIWQGPTVFLKHGIENYSPDGNADLIFILGQYYPRLKNTGLLREDILEQKNGLLWRFQRSLISSIYRDAPSDAFVYDTARWYFKSGPNVVDTEEMSLGFHSGMPIPVMEGISKDWVVSILTSTIYFNNRS